MIRNVIAVHRLPCVAIKNLSAAAAADLILDSGTNLNILVPAKLSYNNKVVDKNMLWETKLVFRTCQEPTDNEHYAYRLTLADGQVIVLGSGERPYPVTTTAVNISDNMSDSQLTEVTVTLQDARKPACIG